MLFWLLRSFFPLDFSARLLRTSTSPVMHSLLPSGTTKRDSLEEEGSPDLPIFIFIYFLQIYETAASMLLHNNRERHSLNSQ